LGQRVLKKEGYLTLFPLFKKFWACFWTEVGLVGPFQKGGLSFGLDGFGILRRIGLNISSRKGIFWAGKELLGPICTSYTLHCNLWGKLNRGLTVGNWRHSLLWRIPQIGVPANFLPISTSGVPSFY